MSSSNRFARLLAALALAALAAGCATRGETSTGGDPWQGYNRKAFAFNDAVDNAVLKPVAIGYTKVVPAFAQEGVNNFFGNIGDIANGLNNLLQGKPKEGFSDAGRILVNTVLGVFGLWDIATPLGLEKHEEDFGQTLAVWGVNSGPYLVLPLLGPSTARDGPARAVDPSWYYNAYITPDGVYYGLRALNFVSVRAGLLQAESVLQVAALDRYSFVRDAWVQRRRNLVFDGNAPRVKDDF